MTEDPAQVNLAETTNELNWTVYSNGTVEWYRWVYGCWSANPSSLGTYWYVDYCRHVAPWYNPERTLVYHDAEGRYYNYDFGNDAEATYAWHWIRIQGQNDGCFTYSWSYSHTGEWSALLQIDLYLY